MTYRECVIRGQIQSEHFVQLFDSTESLAESVAVYLTAAFETDDNLLIVAKPKHWDAIAAALRTRSVNVAEGIRGRRITVLNAVSTLRAISRNDIPDRYRFEEVVGRTVRELTAGRRLTIYGEMVELLAEEGNFTAALQLEELWNWLSEKTSFRLMCGYSSAHFASPAAEEQLRHVCSAHTHVCVKPDDPLGGWLLQRIRMPFKPAYSPAG